MSVVVVMVRRLGHVSRGGSGYFLPIYQAGLKYPEVRACGEILYAIREWPADH